MLEDVFPPEGRWAAFSYTVRDSPARALFGTRESRNSGVRPEPILILILRAKLPLAHKEAIELLCEFSLCESGAQSIPMNSQRTVSKVGLTGGCAYRQKVVVHS